MGNTYSKERSLCVFVYFNFLLPIIQTWRPCDVEAQVATSKPIFSKRVELYLYSLCIHSWLVEAHLYPYKG